MKKLILPLVAMILCMASCQKENGLLYLDTETYTGNAKLHLDSEHYTVWNNGDEVLVNGNEYIVNVENGKATLADVSEASTYSAVYPASWASADGSTITYPAVQHYRTNGTEQVIDAPMAAYCTGSSLQFKNLGSIIAVNVTNGTAVDVVIDTIEVTAASGVLLNGTATIDYASGSISTLSGGTDTIILDLVDATTHAGVTIAREGSKTFYIALPPTTAKLTIKVQDGIWKSSKSQASALELEASHGYNAPIAFLPPSNEIWYTGTGIVTPKSGGSSISDGNTDYGAAYSESSSKFMNTQGILYFNGTVSNVPEKGFYNNVSNLFSVTLPATVTTVGNFACAGVRNMTAAVMPGVTTMGNSVFSGDTVFSYLSVPNVETMGGLVFAQTKLTSLSFPKLTTFSASVGPFGNAKFLVSVSIPNVAVLKSGTFGQCTALTTVTIANVTEIQNNVFLGCTSLAHIYSKTASPATNTNSYTNVPGTAVLHLPGSCEGSADWGSWPGVICYDYND